MRWKPLTLEGPCVRSRWGCEVGSLPKCLRKYDQYSFPHWFVEIQRHSYPVIYNIIDSIYCAWYIVCHLNAVFKNLWLCTASSWGLPLGLTLQSLGLVFCSGHMFHRRPHLLSATQTLCLKGSLPMAHADNSRANKAYLSTRVSFYFNSKQVTNLSPTLLNLTHTWLCTSELSIYRLPHRVRRVVHQKKKAMWGRICIDSNIVYITNWGKKASSLWNTHCISFFLSVNCVTLRKSPS